MLFHWPLLVRVISSTEEAIFASLKNAFFALQNDAKIMKIRAVLAMSSLVAPKVFRDHSTDLSFVGLVIALQNGAKIIKIRAILISSVVPKVFQALSTDLSFDGLVTR